MQMTKALTNSGSYTPNHSNHCSKNHTMRPTAKPADEHHHCHSPASSASTIPLSRPDDDFWSTSSSTAEERQKIREFWLLLGENERRSLVKIEKDAVLRKMKEQQKHGCNCSVCGKKRTAMEDELEVLYDAYYEELEQYANHQQQSQGYSPRNLQAAVAAALPPLALPTKRLKDLDTTLDANQLSNDITVKGKEKPEPFHSFAGNSPLTILSRPRRYSYGG
ncbi:hypothetical protein DM01DRAFT_1081703 [Hesseltinella vesiculosa]|uniref:Stress response protein NST1 n=1 Tax=Hesseltinella vesiculosa TaxID=101127 RepID=A0A1X2GF03_9FUNG|nr:hypothetical protein DM01DRAFT_1081703 [Hesseltinella vesiculosa]